MGAPGSPGGASSPGRGTDASQEEESSSEDEESDEELAEADDAKSKPSEAATSAIEGLMTEATETLELELDEPDQMFEEEEDDIMTKATKLCGRRRGKPRARSS